MITCILLLEFVYKYSVIRTIFQNILRLSYQNDLKSLFFQTHSLYYSQALRLYTLKLKRPQDV
jgi:hypothetical protein